MERVFEIFRVGVLTGRDMESPFEILENRNALEGVEAKKMVPGLCFPPGKVWPRVGSISFSGLLLQAGSALVPAGFVQWGEFCNFTVSNARKQTWRKLTTGIRNTG